MSEVGNPEDRFSHVTAHIILYFQVEQLADHTGEESVLLIASVSEGSLSHLGSESGKGFLQDHDDIKSQFLGFCMKSEYSKDF